MISVNFDAIPEELTALPQWVVWRLEMRKGKLNKMPYDAKSGGPGKSNDDSTWADFGTAKAKALAGDYSGVGFVFSAGDGLVGIDLDHVIDLETGEINGSAVPILERFAGTYIEVSPSGTGIRIFCRGTPGRCGKNIGKYKWAEIYDHTSPRYLTVTGSGPFYGSARAITEQQEALDWLHSTHFKEQAKPRNPAGRNPQPGASSLALDDQALIRKAEGSKNGAAFRDLFGGSLERHGGDHSSADLALCSLLAWWSNKDAAQIDRIFRQSGLMRDKWDKAHRSADGATYGAMTIERAIQSCVGGYEARALSAPASLPSNAGQTAAGGGGGGESAAGGMEDGPGGGLPEIRLGGGRLVEAMQEAERVLFGAKEPPYFQRGGILAYINRVDMVRDRHKERVVEHGVLQLAPVTSEWLRWRMMKECQFVAWSKSANDGEGGWKPANLTADYANTYLGSGDYWAPVLRAIVEAPVMREDGSLLMKKGYEPKLGLYLDSEVEWKAPSARAAGEKVSPLPRLMTDSPKLEKAWVIPSPDPAIMWAQEVFLDLFKPFQPETSADLAVLVSAVLCGLMKTQVGPAPGVVITAPVFGTGKGKLADVISIIVTGKASPMMIMPNDGRGRGIDEKEFAKKLFAVLLDGTRIVVVDEVRQSLYSPTLDSMLTTGEFKDRVLSLSKMATVKPTDSMFLALGNNVRVPQDGQRRWLRAYLNPKCEEPHKRHFDRDALAHAKANRVEIVRAAYTLLAGYIHAGKPDMGIELGSFERWAALIASAVVWAGFDNPVLTQAAWKEQDADRNLLGALLDAWYVRFGRDKDYAGGITCGDALRIVESAPNDPGNEDIRDALGEICGEKGGFNARKLGKFLSGAAKRVIDGRRFEVAGEKKRAVLWRVVET